MVYISKVYTRFGDAGDTMLVDGSTVGKDHQRVCSYGDIDELNACIGLVRLELHREGRDRSCAEFVQTSDAQLARIQQELFNLGSELATPGFEANGKQPCILPRHIERLEAEIDELNRDLAPLTSFILPGGGATASFAHLARTVCRRAERELVALQRQGPEAAPNPSIRPETQRYVNRLSDYLFVLSRAASHHFKNSEVLWTPEST